MFVSRRNLKQQNCISFFLQNKLNVIQRAIMTVVQQQNILKKTVSTVANGIYQLHRATLHLTTCTCFHFVFKTTHLRLHYIFKPCSVYLQKYRLNNFSLIMYKVHLKQKLKSRHFHISLIQRLWL